MKIISFILMIAGFVIGAYGFILNNDQELIMERRFGGDGINPAIFIVLGIAVIIVGFIIFLKSRKNK